ncbi:23S rRNA (uracil-5-)-methyltransferase [Stappia sp. 22II-S9-Z10]|nr:23S rRNA (uracil-5-)-methyltransferase [Stappia sp. 22II-S9-Z10]
MSAAAAEAPVGVCPLFGRCGGCSHLDRPADLYAAEKERHVAAALAGRGVTAAVSPLLRLPFASRRRATFTAVHDKGGVKIGYQAARSHEVVDVAFCPALDPDLAAALPRIRAIGTAAAAGGRARMTATLTANGVDLTIARETKTPARRKPPRGAKGKRRDGPGPLLIEPPTETGPGALVRVMVDGDLSFMTEPPVVVFAGVAVPFPAGAFLQASRAGEAAMIRLVTEAMAGAENVADLFCGLGTFAVPLTASAKVLAAEIDGPALEALRAGMAHTTGRRALTAVSRNLMHHPLSPQELKGIDGVVFDPPRAGAEAVARELARSEVPRLAAVSCEPATLARDLAILTEGGYKITQVVPVDQFVGTAHIEVVANLERER